MTLCHFVCGSVEQNRGHGRLVSALPGSFLPPLMTSKTAALQKISILTSCSSSIKARCFRFRTRRKGPAVKLYVPLCKCLYTIRKALSFRSWRLMVHPRFKAANEPERATSRSIRTHKRKHLKPDVGFRLDFGFSVNYFLSSRRCHDTGGSKIFQKSRFCSSYSVILNGR